jgi:hypothetical protein
MFLRDKKIPHPNAVYVARLKQWLEVEPRTNLGELKVTF